MMVIEFLEEGCTMEHLGLIPLFIFQEDPRPAKEQFDERYYHGGGWRPFKGFKMEEDYSIQYGDPDEEDADPPLKPVAKMELRDETILMYPYGWVAIVQPLTEKVAYSEVEDGIPQEF